jgi:hypothetical protein
MFATFPNGRLLDPQARTFTEEPLPLRGEAHQLQRPTPDAIYAHLRAGLPEAEPPPIQLGPQVGHPPVAEGGVGAADALEARENRDEGEDIWSDLFWGPFGPGQVFWV